MSDIYLPKKKDIEWNDTESLYDPKKEFSIDENEYKDMHVIDEDKAQKSIYPKADYKSIFEYHHKDQSERHPETLYIVPGRARFRSDSLDRSSTG